jgi:hypothetical protein
MSRATVGAVCLVVLAVLSTAVLVRPGLAEDPKEAALAQIDQGREALAAGKTQAAIDHLQKAIALLQKMTTRNLASFLPAIPEGWKARDPVTNSGSWGGGEAAFQWNSASRTYTRESDGVKVDVMISSSPQLVESQKAMLKLYEDPQMRKMMNMDPSQKIELVKRDGWEGLSIVKKGDDATIVAICGKTMLTLTVSNGAEDILTSFWKAVDLSGLGGG